MSILGLFRRKKTEREPFDSFLMDETQKNPALSLEDALEMYIKKYSLEVRLSLDEPRILTEKRTKLRILQESLFSDPRNCDDPQLRQYVESLRMFVKGFDSYPPEMLRELKKREKDSQPSLAAGGEPGRGPIVVPRRLGSCPVPVSTVLDIAARAE